MSSILLYSTLLYSTLLYCLLTNSNTALYEQRGGHDYLIHDRKERAEVLQRQ